MKGGAAQAPASPASASANVLACLVELMFTRVHSAVEHDTARMQRPLLSSNLTSELCLGPHPDGRCGGN